LGLTNKHKPSPSESLYDFVLGFALFILVSEISI
jgi:hypothetical protein